MKAESGAMPNADHGWLTKLLAVDPLTCVLLELGRTLSAYEWDAFVRVGKRIKVKVLGQRQKR